MKHLVLIGMMGTGKSTIGERIHQKTGYPWIDMDSCIEEKWGITISAFFSQYGEKAFREAESLLLRQLLYSSRVSIISTGGGCVLDEENRKMMLQYGRTVCLTAEIMDIIHRVKSSSHRPLINGDVVRKVKRLVNQRKGLYDFAEITLNTSHTSFEKIANDIISFWNIDKDMLESSNSIMGKRG